MKVRELAAARAGDKGSTLDLTLVAFDQEALALARIKQVEPDDMVRKISAFSGPIIPLFAIGRQQGIILPTMRTAFRLRGKFRERDEANRQLTFDNTFSPPELKAITGAVPSKSALLIRWHVLPRRRKHS